jgi:mRNA-degrading endonuclease RelE of RelBE toxin-antitoxin system
LTGKLQGDYRLRVGDWRILITPDREKRILHVYAILPRGDAY